MSYRRAGLASMGSLLLPEDQEKRIDAMRKDTLDRLDTTARRTSTAVLVGAGVTAFSTAMLIKSAYNLSRGR